LELWAKGIAAPWGPFARNSDEDIPTGLLPPSLQAEYDVDVKLKYN
jgi:hypothetical protein